MIAVGGAWPVTPLLAAAESQFAPDAIDSLAAVAVSPLAKLGMQPGSAVSATTLLVNFTDLFGKLSILAGAYTRVRGPPPPLIKTAAADAKSLAEHLDRVVLLHFFDPFVALEGPSQTIPSVFFRISRCWVNSAI